MMTDHLKVSVICSVLETSVLLSACSVLAESLLVLSWSSGKVTDYVSLMRFGRESLGHLGDSGDSVDSVSGMDLVGVCLVGLVCWIFFRFWII